MGSSDEMDVELLIVAIKKRPCIWNYKLQEYSNKTIKNRAWAAVCEEIVSHFKDKSINEKNAIGIEVQSKWKSLRDGFTRYRRNTKKKSGSAASKVKQYTYYDQLLFLKDVTEDKGQSTSNFDAPTSADPPSTVQSTKEEHVQKKQRKRKNNETEEAEDALIEQLTKKLNAERNPTPSLDEDNSFLLSLLSDFKKIAANWKLDAKLEILQVIKHYKSLSMPSISHSSYNYSGYTTTTNPARPESQLTTNESLSSQDSVPNTMPSTSHSGYSTTTLPARAESQLSNESPSSQDIDANTIITSLFSE